jgi:hypothetical protein
MDWASRAGCSSGGCRIRSTCRSVSPAFEDARALAGRRFSPGLSVHQRRRHQCADGLAAYPSRWTVAAAGRGRACPGHPRTLRQNFTTIFNVTEICSQCLGFASRCCYRPSVCEVGVGGMKRDLEAGPLGGRTAHRGAQTLTVGALLAESSSLRLGPWRRHRRRPGG